MCTSEFEAVRVNRLVKEQSCSNCHSTDHVTSNTTNYAAKYYCTDCNRVFDPDSWECPQCEDVDRVASNPFDDPAGYYCFRCDLAFNRLGFEFDPEQVRYDTTGGADAQLAFDVDSRPGNATGTVKCALTLENVGTTPVETLGPTPIAIQHQVSDAQWWTIHGNPDGYTPTNHITLDPGETFQREFSIEPNSIYGETISINLGPLQSGTYRILYWGLPETDTVLADRLSIEFDYGW